jgi:hypothetical protein
VPELRLPGYSVRRHGLLISDDAPEIPRARIFDLLKHGFNPLAHLGYKEARQLADVLYTVSPQGENTLTVRNGSIRRIKRACFPHFMQEIGGMAFGGCTYKRG